MHCIAIDCRPNPEHRSWIRISIQIYWIHYSILLSDINDIIWWPGCRVVLVTQPDSWQLTSSWHWLECLCSLNISARREGGTRPVRSCSHTELRPGLWTPSPHTHNHTPHHSPVLYQPQPPRISDIKFYRKEKKFYGQKFIVLKYLLCFPLLFIMYYNTLYTTDR